MRIAEVFVSITQEVLQFWNAFRAFSVVEDLSIKVSYRDLQRNLGPPTIPIIGTPVIVCYITVFISQHMSSAEPMITKLLSRSLSMVRALPKL